MSVRTTRAKVPPKTIRNPEYTEYLKEKRSFRYPADDENPEEYGKKLPEDGAWIQLLMSVHVGRQVDQETVEHIDVPHLSIWFAVPTMTLHQQLHQAIIQTPSGAVHVWPHEYRICEIDKFLEFSDQDGFYTHFLSDSDQFPEEALFYLRSRGIPKAQAQRMLLSSLKDPLYCYFTFDEALTDFFPEGTGTPYPIGSRRRSKQETNDTHEDD